MKTEFLQNFKVGEQPLLKEIVAQRLNACRQIRLLSLLKMRQFELYRAIRKSSEITTGFVDKAVNQIITAAESAMREKLSCKATD